MKTKIKSIVDWKSKTECNLRISTQLERKRRKKAIESEVI